MVSPSEVPATPESQVPTKEPSLVETQTPTQTVEIPEFTPTQEEPSPVETVTPQPELPEAPKIEHRNKYTKRIVIRVPDLTEIRPLGHGRRFIRYQVVLRKLGVRDSRKVIITNRNRFIFKRLKDKIII